MSRLGNHMNRAMTTPQLLCQAVLAAGLAFVLSAAPAAAPTSAAQLLGGEEGTPVVRVDPGGEGANSQVMTLGLNKAAVVELPVDASDVLISNPEIADAIVRSARRTYLLGMEVGETNAFFFDQAGRQVLNLEIRVERDIDSLLGVLGRHLPSSRIDVEAINDNIMLTGIVPNAAASSKARDIAARFVGDPEKVLNMLAIEGKEQVLLKVTIAEMQRSLIKQLGIDLSAITSIGDLALRLNTANNFSLQGQSLGGLNTTPRNFGVGGSDLIDGAVAALERNGLLRTLAEPTLTAISGESANFLVGGEFPVPSDRDRNGNVRIEFKPFGVGLAFTPVVLSDGRISMKISTEVSELSSEGAFVSQGGTATDTEGNVVQINGITIPALRVRRAETAVELPSGGSLALAGLLQESTRQNIDGVPGAKDIPILGSLFRSRDYLNAETELVVIVTPYLVDPKNESDFVLPTDDQVPASDIDTILMGRLNGTYGANASDVNKQLQGPVGFVLE
ncbi:type II and III secretion system protein family protein [Pyruvatibacter mobilis]|uniref:type II and III secretion system protein family protein n=1 Tax=Pyruvatibacter mobilis TaxID=1712261 RepID=UPI003BAD0E01